MLRSPLWGSVDEAPQLILPPVEEYRRSTIINSPPCGGVPTKSGRGVTLPTASGPPLHRGELKKTLFIKIKIWYNIHIDKKFSPGGGVPTKSGRGVKKRTIDLQPSPPLRGPPRPGRGIKKRNKERRKKWTKKEQKTLTNFLSS